MSYSTLLTVALFLLILWVLTFIRLTIVIVQRGHAQRGEKDAWRTLYDFEDEVAKAMRLPPDRRQGPRREAIVRQLREDFAND